MHIKFELVKSVECIVFAGVVVAAAVVVVVGVTLYCYYLIQCAALGCVMMQGLFSKREWGMGVDT